VADFSPSARGVYGIAVAAEMAGVGEQALRLYERKGLLTPARTAGGTRRYSEDDMTVLRRVIELLAEGLNLAGVRRVLDLESTNSQLRAHLAHVIGAEAAETRGRTAPAVDTHGSA
jgi:MerR family transcriptional regulator/heat shock protein HspR